MTSSSRPPRRLHPPHDDTSPAVVRVLVVDDSAFARKVIREVLDGHPSIDVVGVARDGADAIEKIAELKPDVITLDLVMPHLDGVGVLEAINLLASPPRAVVVTTKDTDSVLVVAALLSGAFAVVHKPSPMATDRLYELGDELVEKVMLAADAHAQAGIATGVAAAAAAALRATPLLTPPLPNSVQRFIRTNAETQIQMLVVGASTGGPRAVTQLLRALPATFPVPVAIVVHMPAGCTEAFANRLDRESPLEVIEARDGIAFTAGTVVIARAGIHMKIQKTFASGNHSISGSNSGSNPGRRWRVVLDTQPRDTLHRPSVDALFESAASDVGRNVLGVVLTGMGSDGLEGARAIRAAGGQVIVEHESTCVVYGMPRAIADEGLADACIPLPEMAAAIIARA